MHAFCDTQINICPIRLQGGGGRVKYVQIRSMRKRVKLVLVYRSTLLWFSACTKLNMLCSVSIKFTGSPLNLIIQTKHLALFYMIEIMDMIDYICRVWQYKAVELPQYSITEGSMDIQFYRWMVLMKMLEFHFGMVPVAASEILAWIISLTLRSVTLDVHSMYTRCIPFRW